MIPAAIVLALLILCAWLALALRKSLSETLYSYKNIGLCGGLIFTGILIFVAAYWMYTLSECGPAEILEKFLAFPRKFSYYALFVVFTVCVLLGISNVALIRHEGFHPHNALSILVAVFYIGGTLAVYFISDAIGNERLTEAFFSGSRLVPILRTVIPLFLLLLICYFECILAGTAIMGYAAAHQVPAYDRDFIIILGCSIDKRGGLLPLLKGRVNRAARFAWDQERETGKPVKYVPSGGQGPNEVISEGTAMEFYLLTHGAEDFEVFPEKKSRSTWENMVFSKKVIDGLDPEAKVAFATTNYHMLRSGILARKAGIDAEGIAAGTKWYFWPNGFVREFFAILAMEKKTHLKVALVLMLLCMAAGTAADLL